MDVIAAVGGRRDWTRRVVHVPNAISGARLAADSSSAMRGDQAWTRRAELGACMKGVSNARSFVSRDEAASGMREKRSFFGV